MKAIKKTGKAGVLYKLGLQKDTAKKSEGNRQSRFPKKGLLFISLLAFMILLAGCRFSLTISFDNIEHTYKVGSDEILLTFEDGPNLYTSRILEILEDENIAAYNIKAAFFLVGQNIERNPGLVGQIASAGHIVANHSYSHVSFDQISFSSAKYQVTECQRLLGSYGNRRWFRPPFDELPSDVDRWLYQNGYKVVFYSIEGQNIAELEPGDIVRLQSTAATVQELPAIIQQAKDVLNPSP
ncbi:MAG: polysaccharide deacetylase family protein [Halanaerobium sp.]|nr:polysaccharide deacetylase family protein [Halanaerobium sp.]